MNKSTSFFSVTIIAYIIGIIAIIVCLRQGEKLSWESVAVFSIGFVTLSVVYVVVLKYLHEQTIYACEKEKSTELAKAEEKVITARKEAETERKNQERIDYLLKEAIEIAKKSSNDKEPIREDAKKKLNAQVAELKTKVEALKGDFNSTFGDLFALSDEFKALSKTLESVIKGDKPISCDTPSPKNEAPKTDS